MATGFYVPCAVTGKIMVHALHLSTYGKLLTVWYSIGSLHDTAAPVYVFSSVCHNGRFRLLSLLLLVCNEYLSFLRRCDCFVKNHSKNCLSSLITFEYFFNL
jgi:hypothetical protein